MIGNSLVGANCLTECGLTPSSSFSHLLDRVINLSLVGSTRRGVNGLYDIGANVWEWVNSGSDDLKVTTGASPWYGKEHMHRAHRALKPSKTAVIYICFHCPKNL